MKTIKVEGKQRGEGQDGKIKNDRRRVALKTKFQRDAGFSILHCE